MNRAAVRPALSGRLDIWRQPVCRSLSTTRCARDDEPAEPRQPPGSRQRSAAAASELGSLKPSSPSPAAVDARSLGSSSLPTRGDASGPPANMINLRSLRGGRFTNSPRSPGFSGARGRGRGGGRGGGGRGGGAGRRGGGRRRGRDGEGPDADDANYKLTWSAEEQQWINRADQGVVMPHTPSLELGSLAGHGPALATDCSPLGRVEAAMRSMRILGGGKPFHPEGFYNGPEDTSRRYCHDKKPVFFDDPAEAAWLEDASRGEVSVFPPRRNTKTAIVRAAVQGAYAGPQFAATADTLATTASYHARDATYSARHAAEFDAKVRSLLRGGAAKAEA